jgi:hypothetical protein
LQVAEILSKFLEKYVHEWEALPTHASPLHTWHSSGMPVVAFLPTLDATNPLSSSVVLKTQPFVVDAPPSAMRWVTHVASQLAHTAEPLVLVFYGEASVHAPAIGFSRRALRRPAVHYILVDPTMPTIGGDYGDWPDAPVTVVLTDAAEDVAKDAALQSRLRGWTVTRDSIATVLSHY